MDASGNEKHVRVEPIAIAPTEGGCAVFLGDGKKAAVFYTDPGIGSAINAALAGVKAPRPLSHDLFTSVLDGLGATVKAVIVHDIRDDIFYANLYVEAENETLETKKVLEIDSRPSDAIALAVRAEAPIYVARDAWLGLKDMSEVLEAMRREGGPQA